MCSIGQGGPGSSFRDEWPAPIIVLEALSQFVSVETIRRVLTQTQRHSRRIRRLPAPAVLWLVMAIGIWTDLDIPAIWRQVAGSLQSNPWRILQRDAVNGHRWRKLRYS